MQVAVVPVRVVERPRHLVIQVISMWNRDMPARGAVLVAAFDRRARAGTAAVHVQPVLVRVLLVGGVEVAVVQVIDVVAV